MSNENIHTRIVELIETFELTKNSFSNKIGVANTVIGNIVGGRMNKPSYEVLDKIMQSFDNINGHWLITGLGEKFIIRENPDYEKIRIENLKLKEMLKVCDEEKNKYQKRIDELQQDLIQILKKNKKD